MRERIVRTTILLRRGTLEAFETNNPLLYYGEPSFVVDINKVKIGDGVRLWNDLPYLYGGEDSDAVYCYEKLEDLPIPGEEKTVYYVYETNQLYTWGDNEYTPIYKEEFEYLAQQISELPKNIEELGQNEYVIFYCGDSVTNI